MLHLIWYIIIGFLAGCVAKALLHVHLSITWTIVLGIVGSTVGAQSRTSSRRQAQAVFTRRD